MYIVNKNKKDIPDEQLTGPNEIFISRKVLKTFRNLLLLKEEKKKYFEIEEILLLFITLTKHHL